MLNDTVMFKHRSSRVDSSHHSVTNRFHTQTCTCKRPVRGPIMTLLCARQVFRTHYLGLSVIEFSKWLRRVTVHPTLHNYTHYSDRANHRYFTLGRSKVDLGLTGMLSGNLQREMEFCPLFRERYVRVERVDEPYHDNYSMAVIPYGRSLLYKFVM